MKKIVFGTMACLAALFAASCDKQPAEDSTPVEITLSVHPSTLNFSDEGETLQLRVETNAGTIEISDNLTWVSSVETNAGYYNITAAENTDKDERSGEFIVYAIGKDGNSKQASVKVIQSGAGAKTQFEDAEFRRLVLAACDADGDGAISQDEADKVTELDLTYDSESEERVVIKSLSGIQIFRNLKNLDCDFNALTSLDLSGMENLEYLNCSYNSLTTLNLSGCVSLKQIYANVNKLKSLELSGFDNLLFVQAYKNEFTSFTVTGLPELAYLQIDQNSLTKLKVHDCPELGNLNCGSNSLATLDLKNLPKLYTLGCYNNSLTSLDVADFPELLMLECYRNNLTSLDLSACPKLGSVRCSSNLLESLKLPKTELFTYLYCDNNRLKSLDLKDYAALKTLDCSSNFITSLSLDGCASLETAACDNNSLAALDLTGLEKLQKLSCTDNKLTELDVTGNSALTAVDCRRNEGFKTLWIAEGQTAVLKDIKTDDNENMVKVRRDKPVIAVSASMVEVEYKGGNFSIDWSVENSVEGTELVASTKADWIGSIAVESSKVKFAVSANSVESAREAELTLSYGEAEPVVVTVKQAAAPAPAPEAITVRLNYAWYEKYSFSVTTSDASATYIAYVRQKSKVESYKTDDELIAADIARFKEWGTIADSGSFYTGSNEFDGTLSRWTSKDYYVVVYGLTAEGERTGDKVIKIPFTLSSIQPTVSVGTVEKAPVDGGTYTVSYSIEDEYDGEHISVESMDKSWLHIDKVDETAKTITYTVDKNTKISYSYPYTREGSFVIYYADATPCDVTVKQDSPRSSN